jgi:hypothetical protein
MGGQRGRGSRPFQRQTFQYAFTLDPLYEIEEKNSTTNKDNLSKYLINYKRVEKKRVNSLYLLIKHGTNYEN